MGKWVTWFNAHRKSVTAFAGIIIGIATVALGADNRWVTLAVAVATAAGVYAVPNTASKRPAARRASAVQVPPHPDH